MSDSLDDEAALASFVLERLRASGATQADQPEGDVSDPEAGGDASDGS